MSYLLSINFLKAFMYAATTNLIATANGDDKNVEGAPKTKKTLLASLRLGLIVGAVFGLTLGLFAPLFLRILLGGEVVDPVLVLSATRYIRIRAMGMPAAVVIGSAQSACLGIKDVRGPLLVVILAGIVNFCFDILFVPLKNSILGGSAGAAFATSLSQYAALFMFIQWLRIKPKAITETKRAQSTSRGILGKEFRIQHLFKVPHLSDIKKFVPFMVPVTTTAIGRLSGYITMSHVVSSTLGTVDMAAQQIVLAFFSCFVPICDSLSITAQTFMPGIFENKTSDRLERVKTMKKMIMNLIKVGIWYGAILFALVNCVPMISHLFTQDVLVQQSMKAAIPYVAGYFALSGVVCVGEGKYNMLLEIITMLSSFPVV
jgi:Na+-driven multidrug efflux pump